MTGDRPEAFDLCKIWVKNQTKKIDQWIVVDDGAKPMEEIPKDCHYVRRQPKPSDPKHTLVLNMKEALKHIEGDMIFILEDDEYYAPKYIEKTSNALNDFEIIGIGRSKYYHLKGGYIRHMNLRHASLAQIGFKKSFIAQIEKVIEGNSFLDLRIWETLNGKDAYKCDAVNLLVKERITDDKKGIVVDDGEDALYLGIKGMIGRKGIGSGHIFGAHYIKDIRYEKLKQWLGKDFKYYQPYLG